ncbi:MAG: chemotaxis protein CheD [Symbiobacteriia bacterium]
MNDSHTVAVGLGELAVGSHALDLLVCYGLGSCIGIAAYDPVAKIGGLAHVVLPDSALAHGHDKAAKFADTAVPVLLGRLTGAGANPQRLVVKMAGGAQMLAASPLASRLDIGQRNAEAVRAALVKAGMRLAAEDIGGNYGRTLRFSIGPGTVQVSTIGRGEKVL